MKLPEDILKNVLSGELEAIKAAIHTDPSLIQAVDEDERGILHHAVLIRNHVILKWLLDQDDCPITASDEAGWNVLHLAASIGDTEAVSQILCHPKGLSLVNAKNETGNGPLHYASSKGHLQVVRLLCESQADVLLSNKYGQTALHRSAALGHVSIIKTLIDAAPLRLRTNFIDAKDNEGDTALHMAVQDKHEECIAALLEAGARRDIKNNEGQLAIP